MKNMNLNRATGVESIKVEDTSMSMRIYKHECQDSSGSFTGLYMRLCVAVRLQYIMLIPLRLETSAGMCCMPPAETIQTCFFCVNY